MSETAPNEPVQPDLSEKGRDAKGKPISSDRRLFMQLLVFVGNEREEDLIQALSAQRFAGALYRDINQPRGFGLLTASEDPNFFLDELRTFLRSSPFSRMEQQEEMTMFGRTYSIGYEQDLERTLLGRPLERILSPELPWVVWYPLRRKGEFAKIPTAEERDILMEHGRIGHLFGSAGLAQDIRLACFGLDRNDNDFVIGLLGPNLFPLSAVVQTMRKTRQTSEFIEQLGPFFIGKAVWQAQS